MPMRSNIAAVLLALLCGAAVADQPAPPLSGETDIAYLHSTGSSNKETLKGRLDTKYADGAWTHEFKGEGLNESDNDSGLRTSERYLAVAKSSWNFTARDYLFIKGQYEKDQQTDNDYQALIAAGYGRRLVESGALKVSADAGAGTRHSKARYTDDSKDETVGSLALRGEWKFRPGGRLTEDASADIGQSSTVVHTRTALLFDLTDVVGLTIAYETKRDDGPSDINDSVTSVGLNYRFR